MEPQTHSFRKLISYSVLLPYFIRVFFFLDVETPNQYISGKKSCAWGSEKGLEYQ